MSSLSTLKSVRSRLALFSRRIAWLPLLLARLTLGIVFVGSGWGKLQHLSKVTSFFTELGIPAPAFNAELVATCELVCGLLVLVGLVARLATIPLIVTMVVAIATAKRGEIHGLSDLLGQIEFTYILLLVAIALLGPGAASADGAIAGALDRKARSGDGGHWSGQGGQATLTPAHRGA